MKVKMKIKLMWLSFWLALAFVGFVAEVFGWSTVPAFWSFVCLFCAGVVGYVSQEELAALMLEGNV
jgi:hypothetical protein|nr:MAG TPA: hypothetical protein [Caudoviricetes sp.]